MTSKVDDPDSPGNAALVAAIAAWSAKNFGRRIPVVPAGSTGAVKKIAVSAAPGRGMSPKPSAPGRRVTPAPPTNPKASRNAFQIFTDALLTERAFDSARTEARVAAENTPEDLGIDRKQDTKDFWKRYFSAVRLLAAVRNKRVLSMSYDGHDRIVEPHAYGRNANHELLRAWQTEGGHVTPGHDWCMFIVPKIQKLKDTGETFDGPRPLYSPGDQHMTQIFAQV